MTPIFYGADTICTAQHSLPFFERILYYGYFLALAIAIFCYLVFRKMFMNLYKKYRAMKESDEGIDRRISKIPTAISTRTNGN